MSPSLTFLSSPRITDLEKCSARLACNSGDTKAKGEGFSPLGNVKIEIFNNSNNTNNSNTNLINLDQKGTQKFSKFTKVKGYFCQIGLFVLELFIALFCYVLAIVLLFNLIFAAAFSLTLRLVVRLIFSTCYAGLYKLIDRGADAVWAVESGFGASSSNIVIGLKCRGIPNIDKIIKTFESKVLNFKTRLHVKKENGTYIQEESGEYYEPYQKLKWIVVEKFLFFCMKKDLEFCASNHFSMEETQNDNESLEERMQTVMEKCITKRMSHEMPQWRFHIVTKDTRSLRQQSEYGIIFTIHHSYGDGISWVQMFRYAFADQPVKPSIDPMGKSPSLSSHYFSSSEPLATRIFRWIQTVLLFPHYFSRQMVYVWRETNRFHGPFVKNNGTCRWNSSLSMKQIKAIRVPISTASASTAIGLGDSMTSDQMIMKPAFSALLSSCIAASFTRLFRDYQARVPGKVLAILPYADLPYRTLHPLNNFYSHFLPIPTSITNSRARLLKCDKYTKSFNPPSTKPVNTLVAHVCGLMITPLQKLVGISARSTVGFSNVPGPAEKIKLFDGDEVVEIILFPPLKYRTAIVVGFISYGDQLTMSICVDETIKNHSTFATHFMEYFQEELKGLIEISQTIAYTNNNNSNVNNLATTAVEVVAVGAGGGNQSDETSGNNLRNSLISQELNHSTHQETEAASPINIQKDPTDFVVNVHN